MDNVTICDNLHAWYWTYDQGYYTGWAGGLGLGLSLAALAALLLYRGLTMKRISG